MIEDLRPGDWVLSRDEYEPHGAVERKQVEEVFFRLGGIWHVHVNGEVIRTTGEHPFWVEGKGWTRANELSIGDKLLCEDGTYANVEDLLDTGDVEAVYNFRVTDYHTYFVGTEGWGWAVWAHNVYNKAADIAAGSALKMKVTHIFRGEGTASTKLGGMHHMKNGVPPPGVTVVATAANKTTQGVYNTRWSVPGKPAAFKGKESTVFPNDWTKKDVKQAIEQAVGSATRRGKLIPKYDATGKITSYKFQAKVKGVLIQGYLSASQKTILTAYPVLPKALKGIPGYNA